MWHSRLAFTLVELLVAVAIIGVLVMLILPQYGAYMTRARRGEARVNLGQISSLQGVYSVENYEYRALPLAGYKGTCDFSEGSPLAALGFTPPECDNMRYGYEVFGGSRTFRATAFAPSDADGRWVYPKCSGAGASECGESSGDKLVVTHDKHAEVCRNIVKYCPEDAGTGGDPPDPHLDPVLSIDEPPPIDTDPDDCDPAATCDCTDEVNETCTDDPEPNPCTIPAGESRQKTETCYKETNKRCTRPANACPTLSCTSSDSSKRTTKNKQPEAANKVDSTAPCSPGVCTESCGECKPKPGSPGVCEKTCTKADCSTEQKSCTCCKDCVAVNKKLCRDYEQPVPLPEPSNICQGSSEPKYKSCSVTKGTKNPPSEPCPGISCSATTTVTTESALVHGTKNCVDCSSCNSYPEPSPSPTYGACVGGTETRPAYDKICKDPPGLTHCKQPVPAATRSCTSSLTCADCTDWSTPPAPTMCGDGVTSVTPGYTKTCTAPAELAGKCPVAVAAVGTCPTISECYCIKETPEAEKCKDTDIILKPDEICKGTTQDQAVECTWKIPQSKSAPECPDCKPISKSRLTSRPVDGTKECTADSVESKCKCTVMTLSKVCLDPISPSSDVLPGSAGCYCSDANATITDINKDGVIDAGDTADAESKCGNHTKITHTFSCPAHPSSKHHHIHASGDHTHSGSECLSQGAATQHSHSPGPYKKWDHITSKRGCLWDAQAVNCKCKFDLNITPGYEPPTAEVRKILKWPQVRWCE